MQLFSPFSEHLKHLFDQLKTLLQNIFREFNIVLNEYAIALSERRKHALSWVSEVSTIGVIYWIRSINGLLRTQGEITVVFGDDGNTTLPETRTRSV